LGVAAFSKVFPGSTATCSYNAYRLKAMMI